MGNIIQIKDKRDVVVAATLKTYSDHLDRAYRFIIGKPQVTLVEAVGFAAARLKRLISVCPKDMRENLTSVAIEILSTKQK